MDGSCLPMLPQLSSLSRFQIGWKTSFSDFCVEYYTAYACRHRNCSVLLVAYHESLLSIISVFISGPAHFRPQIALPICFFFAEADSLFPKGKPLVLLSAPVFLLILPLLLAKRIHHKPTEAREAEPTAPRTKELWLVEV